MTFLSGSGSVLCGEYDEKKRWSQHCQNLHFEIQLSAGFSQ
jgi:hypothetical protein